MTTRTFAHNTGMVDLSGQRHDGRGGQFHLFHSGPQVKVMEASYQAYSQADVYRRTVVQVKHENASHLADMFRLQAPGSRDLVYHGPNSDYQVSGIDLENVRTAESPAVWTARWSINDQYVFAVHHCGQPGEVTYIGDGWGQRDHRDTDRGVTIPYIIRRQRLDKTISTFCTVYEGHPTDEGSVGSVSRLAFPADDAENVVGLRVNTESGTDIIISQLEPTDILLDTTQGEISTDAKVAVISFRGDDVTSAAIAEGTRQSLDGSDLEAASLAVDPELTAQAGMPR